MSEILLEMVRFSTWANLKLIDACRGLTPAQLAAVSPGTYGGIAATFVHYLGAEEWALGQLRRSAVPDPLVEGTVPDFDTMAAHATETGAALAEVAAAAVDDNLLPSTEAPGEPRWAASVVFAELISHSLEHRTHVMTALTQLGVAPPYLGAFIYAQERGKV